MRLLQLREEISTLPETRSQSTATVKLVQSTIGQLSRMHALQQQTMAQSGQQRAEVTLQRIGAAFARCSDGNPDAVSTRHYPAALLNLALVLFLQHPIL